MSLGLSAFHDLGMSPASKVIDGQPPAAAWSYDVDQFKNYDLTGIRFGYDVIGYSDED